MPSMTRSGRRLIPIAGRGTSSLPPEIWRAVAEQIQGQRTLQALVQVCRLFRDIFRPFLHRKFTIDLSRHETTALARKTLPDYLAYTKEFEVLINEFKQSERHSGIYYNIDLNDGYSAFVVRALTAMPNLRSLRWLNTTFCEDYDTCLILNNEELLATSKRCPNLRNLWIQFSDTYLDEAGDAMKCNAQLKGFKNLASLELYQFYGEESELINDIAHVLKDCPGLKRLGLGMACEFDCDLTPEVLAASGDCDFLEKLCVKYGRRSSPLALETLRLGHGMFVYKSKSPNAGNYLSKLVKFSDVKNLHIYNGLIHETDDWDLIPMPMQVQWNFFTECTSLCQLSVTRLDKTIRRWLNTSGKSIRELWVTEHFSMYDNCLGNFDILELPQLEMLFTREMTVRGYGHDRPWRGIDSESREQISLPRRVVTALDRLPDNIANLTRLGICIELENQWVQFSSHLPKMQRLTYLRMDGKSHRPGRYPAASTSLWPRVRKPKEIAKRYIQLMRSKCPSLQYVQVGTWAWHITAPLPGVPVREAAADTKVELRELEWEERMEIELFALDTFAQVSGLPGPDDYHEELSEEEDRRMERMMAEVEARIARGDPDLMGLI